MNRTFYGGDGNDVIWTNRRGVRFYGDAGNDILVGGNDRDTFIGGIGDDIMYGQGGDTDFFYFCDDFGNDTIYQTDDGGIFLWFNSGSIDNWNADTLTYTDGDNSLTIHWNGNPDDIEIYFGAERDSYYTLVEDKVFAPVATTTNFTVSHIA